MNRYWMVGLGLVAIAGAGLFLRLRRAPPKVLADGYVGSASCRSCHEHFYKLWSTSHHGLAMQPFTADLAQREQISNCPEIRIGDNSYKAEINDQGGSMVETGAAGEHRYPIEQTLGGKNVYYFLTPLEHGHLQVLPLAYDVRAKAWMDSTMSMTMH
jgi:hypothetical protein